MASKGKLSRLHLKKCFLELPDGPLFHAVSWLPTRAVVRTMSTCCSFQARLPPSVTTIDCIAKINNNLAVNMASRFPNLCRINLEGIANENLFTLAKGCPGLISIDLHDCDKITDVGIGALAQGCPGLINIDLCNCFKVTDVGIGVLAEGCPGLTSIVVRHCFKITDVGIGALAVGCPGLTSIDLCSCSKITDVGIRALAEGCPGILISR